jgi:hypothetical protein
VEHWEQEFKHNGIKIHKFNQSLVGSVVIGAEFGREDHGSIPRNCGWEEDKTTWCQTPNQIQLVVKIKKNNNHKFSIAKNDIPTEWLCIRDHQKRGWFTRNNLVIKPFFVSTN